MKQTTPTEIILYSKYIEDRSKSIKILENEFDIFIEKINKQINETLALSRKQFIKLCKAWIKEFGKMEIINPLECPLHSWVIHNKVKCSREMVPNTMICPICGHPCCPDCMNHNVEQLSRVTGYMSGVSGWNAAKQQEFRDRTRHEIL